MKTPGIIDGIVVAIAISLGAGAATLVLGGFVAYATLFNLLLCAATLIYLLYLLKRSNARVGRVVVIVGWGLISLACWFFNIALFEQVLVQAGIIWLTRSLYFHASIVAALLDLILIVMASGAAVWAAIQTDSLITAVWSFFLCQSLFGSIPDLSRKANPQGQACNTANDPFENAHRAAQEAVRKLSVI